MFIPIRTDYRMRNRPVVNYALLAANVLVFVLGFNGLTPANIARIDPWMLQPALPKVYQFVTSAFLHADWMHLIGNMLFLWVFGNALNDRLGHVAYLAFYLAGGVLAAVGYILLGGSATVLGASGAIAAVTGAYLVLLPRARVTLLLFLFYFITTVEISSLYFLLFQFAYNLWMSHSSALAGGGGVAYTAHISGYVYGIGISAALLALRILPRDSLDLLNLFRAARRRRRFRRMVQEGYRPFATNDPGEELRQRARARPARRVPARTVEAPDAAPASAEEFALRREISQACAVHDVAAAARKYIRLLQMAPDSVLTRQNQLDVAAQLTATQQYAAAADAYERFLRHFRKDEKLPEICLMLGLIYGRYLEQYDRAEPLLLQACQTLADPRKQELAQTELETFRRHRGS